MIDYSVVIRTTGQAHEKYKHLLKSIEKLKPQPKEIIVVLPEGNIVPEERLGWESYYFCPNGMVIQRMTGIAKCKTKYALVCDDDVEFDSDFVRKLYEPIRKGKGKFSAGSLYSFLPPIGFNAVLCTIMGTAVPTIFHRDRYVSVLRTAGYSYNRHLENKKYYETQSVAWTCFFCDIAAVKNIDFNDEIWLDAHGYSSLDDQTMFYKAWLRGIKTIVVSNAEYHHLDARTSSINNKEPVLYSLGFNKVVFWHRFIFKMQKSVISKLWTIMCFLYSSAWILIFDIFNLMRRKLKKKDLEIKIRGYFEGWKYVKSDQYKNLPSVLRK